jgi:glycosyltransferase involved in cell wall biosynthesis
MGDVLHLIKQPALLKIPTEIQTKVEDFPTVSVVTLLHNRPKFFPLAVMNYLGTDYPRSKLEWIIVDDSSPENRVTDALPKDDDSIHYYCFDSKMTIAEKRNIGVTKANHDIIAFMDDDDIYQPRHLLVRLAYLTHYNKQCSYASAIGCFHIGKLISTMNVPPLQYPPEYRCSEATLTFTRRFWEARPFEEKDSHNEGRHFLQSRYSDCVEVPFKPIIVSLLHSGNISNRAKNIGDTPNGCHFGLSDDLFKFITSLEKTEAPLEETGTEQVAVNVPT